MADVSASLIKLWGRIRFNLRPVNAAVSVVPKVQYSTENLELSAYYGLNVERKKMSFKVKIQVGKIK